MNKSLKINSDYILQIEIKSFFNLIEKHWSKEIEFLDINNNLVKIPLCNLRSFIEHGFIAFNKNLTAKIFGADIMNGFEIKITHDIEFIKKLCNEIFIHPEKFYSIDDDTDYSSVKYIWVSIPGQTDLRIFDFIRE